MLQKIFFLLFLSIVSNSYSQTKLASFFSDRMVLQQNKAVSIWGKDKPKTTVEVIGNWGQKSKTKTDKQGNWKLKIQTPAAGGPYTLSVKGNKKIVLKDILIGEVWLCSGQSNMQMPVKGFGNQPINGSQEAILNSKNTNIRMFHTTLNASLTPLDDVKGDWKTASPENTGNFSATAYFFGKQLESILKVPVGLIVTCWGGSSAEAWVDKETLSQYKTIELPSEINLKRKQQTPTALYNAMLHPFIGYSIKGSIWYQGEANRERADNYNNLMTSLISSWRKQWNQGDFPFYFTQIAPYNYGKTNSAYLREAQLKTSQTLKNTGMVVTLDIGDCNFIHPREKKTVGERLAYWALSKNYNLSGIEYAGPRYTSMKLLNNKIELKFENAPNGISSFGKEFTAFEIAGEDKVFYPAKAKIKRNNLVDVSSDKVQKPIAVRYAFKNCVEASLFSTSGLPASSFRTDSWAE